MIKDSIIKVTAPTNLLQTIRASHAISEAGYTLALTASDEAAYAALAQAFPETISLTFAGGREVSIEIDHRTPLTSVGPVSRPLIFPSAIVDRCRTLWSQERDIYCVFRGYMTHPRQKVLTKARRLLDQWPPWAWITRGSKVKVVFAASKKGRAFPGKSWDEPFYVELGRSRFVLCPSGDYVWTYRFFEAALCGAIPIVEKAADCYHGFRFYTLEELKPDLDWSEADAIHNFELCRDLLTVPRETLRSAVQLAIREPHGLASRRT